MRFTLVISLALSLFTSGCASSGYKLVGGNRVVHYPAGVAVPGVSATDNNSGYWLLTDEELLAILKP